MTIDEVRLMNVFEKKLDSYAKLIIDVGINLQDKQPLVISGQLKEQTL